MANRLASDSGDLVASGEFSTPKEIRGALEIVRLEAGARFCVLAVFELPNQWLRTDGQLKVPDGQKMGRRASSIKSRKLFRSLLFAAHEDAGQEERLQTDLLGASVANGIAVPAREASWPHKCVLQLLLHPPFTALGSHASPKELRITEGRTQVSSDQIHRVRAAVVLGTRSHTPVHPPEFQAALIRLKQLVEHSEAVAVNRSLTLADSIDRVLQDCETYVADLSLPPRSNEVESESRELRELSRLALTVTTTALLLTQSDVADLFLTGKHPDRLFVAASVARRPRDRIRLVDPARGHFQAIRMSSPLVPLLSQQRTAPPRTHSDSTRSVVEHVHATGRPLVINGIRDFTEMHGAVRYNRPPRISPRISLADLRELSVPVSASRYGAVGDPASFGVLNLEKRGGSYTGNDLFIARILA